jgi:hypothetical protein
MFSLMAAREVLGGDLTPDGIDGFVTKEVAPLRRLLVARDGPRVRHDPSDAMGAVLPVERRDG